MELYVPRTEEIRVRSEGLRVLLIQGGRTILDVPYQAARAIAEGLKIHSLRCEEQDQAPRIINDQAILIRAGFRFGLTNRPDMLKEAGKVALTDRNLRRYIPSIKGTAIFGTPGLKKLPGPTGG